MRLCSLLLVALLLSSSARAQLRVEEAFPGLSFSLPLDFEHADDGSDRLYVSERAGKIKVFENDPAASSSATFLDIQSQVSATGEGGLLGLAFHPDYAENGYFYVSYTTGGPFRSRISRFTRSDDNPEQADPTSELVLLEIGQPFTNHNGGDLAFGPDGYLYASFGDGGSGGDPEENGQDAGTLLGTLLRLDVDGGGTAPDCGGPDANYTVPADNALADGPEGVCDEIFAYGLRNPFRFSFDRQTGELWVGDVGQGALEEVDRVENGDNLGWNTYEGTNCFDGPCDPAGLTFPVWEYGRSQGNSITGGFVYRGSAVPELAGKYVYADFGSGRIWALTVDESGGVENEQLGVGLNSNIPSFGEDSAGELYFTRFDGKVYRFVSDTSSSEESGAPGSGLRLDAAFPNPFSASTEITFAVGEAGPARVAVYDVLGREVAVLRGGVVGTDEQTVRFAAAGLSSGVYVVRLQAGTASLTRTVVLAR